MLVPIRATRHRKRSWNKGSRSASGLRTIASGLSDTPHHRSIFEERQRPPGVRGHPLRTCCGRTPRRIPPPRPPVSGDRYYLRVFQHARHSESLRFVAAIPRPARSHAYASPQPWLTPPTAGYRLGQDAHRLDDTQCFMESFQPLIPFDPQGLIALEFLSSLRDSADKLDRSRMKRSLSNVLDGQQRQPRAAKKASRRRLLRWRNR